MKEQEQKERIPADPYGEEGLSLLREAVRDRMSEKRYRHTLGVEKKAAELAAVYAPEKTALLRAAALLHDLTKELPAEEQILLCRRFGVSVPRDCLESPKLFHSLTASLLIPEEFPLYADPALLQAVARHTAGHPRMMLCDKLLYLADWIEDTRTFPGCVKLRTYYEKKIRKADTEAKRLAALDQVMLRSFDVMIREILAEKRPLALITVETRNALLRDLAERKNERKTITHGSEK